MELAAQAPTAKLDFMESMPQATPERKQLQPPGAGSPGSAFSSPRRSVESSPESSPPSATSFFSRVATDDDDSLPPEQFSPERQQPEPSQQQQQQQQQFVIKPAATIATSAYLGDVVEESTGYAQAKATLSPKGVLVFEKKQEEKLHQQHEQLLLQQQLAAAEELRALASSNDHVATVLKPAQQRLQPPPPILIDDHEPTESTRKALSSGIAKLSPQAKPKSKPKPSYSAKKSLLRHSVQYNNNIRQQPPPPHASNLNDSTPRVSNSGGQRRPGGDQRKALVAKNGSEEWDAVEAVSTSMNRALGKLKDLTTPFIGGDGASLDGAAVPDVVNTSTESSASSRDVPSCDDSTDHGSSAGFDLKELEAELRGKKEDEQSLAVSAADVARADQAAPSPTSDQIQRECNASTLSFDTLGVPKPARLAPSCPVPLGDLKKPVPLPLTLSRSVLLANNAAAPRQGTPTRETHPDEAEYRAALRLSRAVTPIMRMRNTGAQELATLDETRATTDVAGAVTAAATEVKKSPKRNEEEYKAHKQKKWKAKISHLKKQREEEFTNLSLDGRVSPVASEAKSIRRARKKTSPKKSRKVRGDASSYRRTTRRDSVDQKGIIEIMEKFLLSRCGNLEDALFKDEEDSDDDDSVESSSEYSDDDETALTEAEALGREHSIDYSATTAESEATSVVSAVKPVASASKPASRDLKRTALDAESRTSAKTKGSNEATKPGIRDKQFIREFTQAITKEGILLLLHKQIHKQESLNARPTKSVASIQLGAPRAETGGHFVGPRLVWNAFDDAAGTSGHADLFEIRSLNKATALQLESYPLAMPGRSLFLRMDDAEYVFETKSEEEALRFVHGMRWVIARLSFNLIIGNLSVSCELLNVERNEDNGDHGKFPNTLKEESQWTMAMNDVTSHLVDKAAMM